MKTSLFLARSAVLLLTLPASLAAQRGRGGAPTADTSFGVSWRNIGPNQSGRMVAVAGSTARPQEYYMGTTGGGVWKTTDGGVTSVPVSDAFFGGTIGALAVQQSNPDVVWSGGGETPIRGNVSHGDGVWKTTDAGKTWTYMGLKETQYISRVRIDPTNPDIVYVGALGHVFGPNPDRGVFKTTDGGKTWKKILFRNDSTGIADLILDPGNPKIIYATFWQTGRKPWMLVSGGKGSGIFKSVNGGDTWTEITRNPGLPQTGLLGAIGITVSPAKTSRLWAIVEHEAAGGVYRSDDAGATWTYTSSDRNLRQRAWYYSKLYADPKDTNVVYAPQVSPMISKDGGKTFARGFGGGDNHDIWIDPTNPGRLAVAHDNGTIFTTDSGRTSVASVTATGQYYHVHLTSHFPYHVCGAKQDAGSSCGPVRVAAAGGRGGGGGGGGRGGPPTPPPSPFSTFYGVAGGESGYVSSNPEDPDIMYGANYGGSLDMLNRRTGKTTSLDPWPLNPMGHDAKDSKYRFQWTYPIVHSPHDANTIYVGSNVVFRSTNGGQQWIAISPDLTRNDPRTLGPSGGDITKDQTSVEYYGTVFTIAESPITKGVIWTGSDDGLIQISRNNGLTWKNVTPKNLPEWMRWSIIEASPHAAGTLYAAGNRYQMDDFTPYLYRTTDYGVTWKKITNGIPADQFTRAIREDLHRAGMLYAATERGVFVSYDSGANWTSLQRNLPPVPVHDMMLRDDDLAIATHGRAFWVMENLTSLRWADREVAAAGKPFLYQPAPVLRLNGQAAPTFVYRLPPDTSLVKFELYDKAGKLLATATSADTAPTPGGRGGGGGFGGPAISKPSNVAGINRFTWNMRHDNAITFRGMINWAGSGNGPSMAPGSYKVKMTAGRYEPVTADFVVDHDPRSPATNADLVEQTRFALQVRDRITEANQGVITIRNLKNDMQDRAPKMTSNPAFATLIKSVGDKLGVVEDSLYQTKNQSGQDPLNYPIRLNDQLGGLMGFIASGERRPPKQAYDVYAVLGGKLDVQSANLKRIIAIELPKVNAMLKAAGLAEIVPNKVEPPAKAPTFVP